METLVNVDKTVYTSHGHYPSLVQLRSGRERRSFALRNARKWDTTLTLYNTGKRLVMCPVAMPADSYYNPVAWKMIKPQDFCDDDGFLVISDKKFAGIFRDQVRFCTMGHDETDTVTIKIGTIGFGNERRLHRTFVIPPKFIQFVCVHLGRVKDSLLVYSPLPYQIIVGSPVAERMPDQYLVAVKAGEQKETAVK